MQIIENKSKLNLIHCRVVLVLLSELVEDEILWVQAGFRAQSPIKHHSQVIQNIISQEYPHLSFKKLKMKNKQLICVA